MPDWTYADDYATQTLIRETPHGIFRAVVKVDEYPDAPEFECGDPVLRLSGGYHYGRSLGDAEYGNDILDAARAWGHFEEHAYQRDTFETFDRWLRIFHDGSATKVQSSAYQGGDEFLVYTCRELLLANGHTDESIARLENADVPETAEWQAYIDGDVYGIDVERAVDFDDDGEPTDWESCDRDCGGFYGEQYATEQAEAELDDEIKARAASMLPID